MPPREIDDLGARGVVERIRARVGDRPVYVSIDIDVLDPAFAPGTGTPEAGGMTSRELLAVLRGFAGLDLVGADIVEVAPAYDHAEITGIAASHVAYELLSAMAPEERVMTPLAFAESLVAAFGGQRRRGLLRALPPRRHLPVPRHPGPHRVAGGVRGDVGGVGARRRLPGARVRVDEPARAGVRRHRRSSPTTCTPVRLIEGAEDEVFERETIVLRREGDAWTCVHEHLSPDPARSSAP